MHIGVDLVAQDGRLVAGPRKLIACGEQPVQESIPAPHGKSREKPRATEKINKRERGKRTDEFEEHRVANAGAHAQLEG